MPYTLFITSQFKYITSEPFLVTDAVAFSTGAMEYLHTLQLLVKLLYYVVGSSRYCEE